MVGGVHLIPSSFPLRISDDVLIGGVSPFRLLHFPVTLIVRILIRSFLHSLHLVHTMKSSAARRFFCSCPPRSLVLVSPSSAGRFFAPYQQGEAGICAPSNTWFSQVADEDASDTESVANRNICSCLRRGQIHVGSFMCIPSRN